MEKEFEIKEILAIIGALIIGVVFLIMILTQRKMPEPDVVQTFRNTCDKITPHPAFHKAHQNESRKPKTVLRSINYSSPAKPDEVEKHYVKLLTSSGWQYTRENQVGTIFLKFRKGNYKFNIELPKFSLTSNRIYLVGCSVDIF